MTKSIKISEETHKQLKEFCAKHSIKVNESADILLSSMIQTIKENPDFLKQNG